jgi:hypothetical protein
MMAAALYELAARGVVVLLLVGAALLAHQWRCDCRSVRRELNPGDE